MHVKKFEKWNNFIGLIAFLIALTTYSLTDKETFKVPSYNHHEASILKPKNVETARKTES